ENGPDFDEGEVLFKPKGEQSAVSASKTEERVPHLVAVDARDRSDGGIHCRRVRASVTQRRQQAAPVVNRKVDGHPHQPRPLVRVLDKAVSMLPQPEAGRKST